MLDVISSNVLCYKAVICDDDFYVFVKLPDAFQQHLDFWVAQERLSGDGDLRVDI